MIRPLLSDDTQALLDIYNYYVLHTAVTFDVQTLTFEKFQNKINRISSEYPFIVYEEGKEVLGFAYGSRFRPKPAYSATVESTVYVKHTAHGKQIGTKLYKKLIEELRQANAHTVLGVLTVPNEASIKLHENFGFRKVAYLKEVGLKFGKWQDIGIWQLKLD